MRKKSITLLMIPIFLIFSVGLNTTDSLSVQSYIATDANNGLTRATVWSNATIISDDATGWNDDTSEINSIAIDGDGNVHVVWEDSTDGEWGTDSEIMYAKKTATGWSNATVISDDATGWNDGDSSFPSITIDGDGNVHVVWEDSTDGEWGTDIEIMYANYTGLGWSNATVISDDATGWNVGSSFAPEIVIDGNGNLHVVWYDLTDGEWGTDWEIMYTNNTGSSWSNATVISDDATGWNDGSSSNPDISIDGDGNLHVVWEDETDVYGIEFDIMYANCTGVGWSNATVISDDVTNWNDDESFSPDIAIDSDGNIHVVWQDYTIGTWGTDTEIMYTKRTGAVWSNPFVISDDLTGWNDGSSSEPAIAIDGNGNLHVVWSDGTDGEWGTDQDIIYVNNTGAYWSNATLISDDATDWNNGASYGAAIAIDGYGNVHVVWQDETDGEWGTDREIMYAKRSAIQPGGEQEVFIIIPIPDSSISLLSPLGLGIIGIAIATAVIISVIITKKLSK